MKVYELLKEIDDAGLDLNSEIDFKLIANIREENLGFFMEWLEINKIKVNENGEGIIELERW